MSQHFSLIATTDCFQFVLVLNEMVLVLVIEKSDRAITSTADG